MLKTKKRSTNSYSKTEYCMDVCSCTSFPLIAVKNFSYPNISSDLLFVRSIIPTFPTATTKTDISLTYYTTLPTDATATQALTLSGYTTTDNAVALESTSISTT